MEALQVAIEGFELHYLAKIRVLYINKIKSPRAEVCLYFVDPTFRFDSDWNQKFYQFLMTIFGSHEKFLLINN